MDKILNFIKSLKVLIVLVIIMIIGAIFNWDLFEKIGWYGLLIWGPISGGIIGLYYLIKKLFKK